MQVKLDIGLKQKLFYDETISRYLTRPPFALLQKVVGPDPDNIYEPHYGADKIWCQDREMMKRGHFRGIQAFAFEDFVVQESMGSIADRSTEHLGTSDTAIIRMRRLLLDMVHNYQEGKEIPQINLDYDFASIHANHQTFDPEREKALV